MIQLFQRTSGKSIHQAICQGQLKYVQALLEDDRSYLNMTDQHGYTPLQLAAEINRLEIAKYLLELGADANGRADDHLRAVRTMPENPALMDDAAALLTADERDELAHSRGQITYTADGAHTINSDTPLLLAARAGHVVMVALLLDYGADPHLRDPFMSTPLHETRSTAIAHLLLEHGADFTSRSLMGWSPLHQMGQNCARSAEVMAYLIEKGAEVDARDVCDMTPLHYAASYGSLAAAEVLLDHGADVNARGFEGMTPLHQAAYGENYAVVAVLLRSNAQMNALNDDGDTPLAQAMKAEQKKMARFLRDHGGMA